MAIEVIAGYAIAQRGPLRVQYRSDLEPDAVFRAIDAGGEILKRSSKSETCRVGDWVVKRSRLECGLGPIKRTLARNRYRRAWLAANYLRVRGVRVPTPLAYAETLCCGLVFGNTLVTEYLDGYLNVEVFSKQMVTTEGPAAVEDFFRGLAGAVNGLTASGAFHADLSGKNIFTLNGQEFCFIDLDGVVLGKTYTDTLRMKNHIQLYDSFCDFCPDETLVKFHARMLPDGSDLHRWMEAVRAGQKARRNLHGRRSAR